MPPASDVPPLDDEPPPLPLDDPAAAPLDPPLDAMLGPGALVLSPPPLHAATAVSVTHAPARPAQEFGFIFSR
jgi:hypothetical protein